MHSPGVMLNLSVLCYADHSLIVSDLNQVYITQIKTTHVGAVAEVFRVPWVAKLEAFETAALLAFEHLDQ